MKKWAALLTVWLAAASATAHAAGFSRQYLQVPGKITVAVARDIEGRGLMDLTVSYAAGEKPNARAHVAVFYARPGGYGAAPDADIELPADACLFDIAAVRPGGKLELVVLRKQQVQSRPLARDAGGEWTTLVSHGTGVLFPSADGVVAFDQFVRDWFGDGGVEIAVPDYGALLFFRGDENGKFDPAGKAPMKAEGSLWISNRAANEEPGSRLQSSAALPRVFSASTPAGQIVALTAGEEIWTFRVHDGRLSEKGARSFLPILTETERQADNTNVTTVVEDLNGDGWPDLAMLKVGGSLTNFRSAVRIYRGGPDGFAPTPAYALDFPGFIPALRFWDIVNDGKREMFIPLVEVGMMQIARVFMSQSLRVKIMAFRAGADFYGKDPKLTREVTMKVNTDRGMAFLGYPPNFTGDFDGDGLPDLLMSHGDGFAVWRNLGNMTFAGDPMMSAAVEPWENVRLVDLNGDKRCDVFAWDNAVTARRGKVMALLNQK